MRSEKYKRVPKWAARFKALGLALLSLFYDVRISRKGRVSINLKERK